MGGPRSCADLKCHIGNGKCDGWMYRGNLGKACIVESTIPGVSVNSNACFQATSR